MSKKLDILFKTFTSEKFASFEVEGIDSFILGACYFLASRHLVNLSSVDDLVELYDNLFINSEIITAENYENYDMKRLTSRLGISEKTLLKQLEKYNFILDYYTNLEGGTFRMKTCKIRLLKNYELNF